MWLTCDVGKILGQGAFGKVVHAEAVGIIEAEENTAVAVKMVRGKFHSINCGTYLKPCPLSVHLTRFV